MSGKKQPISMKNNNQNNNQALQQTQPSKQIFKNSVPIYQQNFQQPQLQFQPNLPNASPSSQRNIIANSQQLICPFHPMEVCKRLCSSIGCTKKILLCSECFYEDPDHVKLHKEQIMTIPDFLQKIDQVHTNHIITSQSQVKALSQQQNIPQIVQDLALNDQHYVQELQNALNHERRKITTDFQKITTTVLSMIEQSMETIQQSLEYHYNAIIQSISEFKQRLDPLYNSFKEQSNPRIEVEYLLSASKDYGQLQQQLKQIRDKCLGQTFQGNNNVQESKSHIQKSIFTAERIKLLIQNPPTYKPLQPEISQEITQQFQDILKVLIHNLQSNLSLPRVYDDVISNGMFENFLISEDNLSAKLPINGTASLEISQQPSHLQTFHKGPINCIKSILDTPFIASGSMDGIVMVWNIDNGELVTQLQGHKGPITSLGSMKSKLVNDQVISYIISGSIDKNIILWDLDDENNTLVFKGHQDTVTSIISLEDNKYIATGGADRKIIIWDAVDEKMENVQQCNGSIYALHKLKVGGGRNYFISSDFSQELNLYKLDYGLKGSTLNNLIVTLERVILTPNHLHSLSSSTVNPLMMIGSCNDKTVKIWNFNFNIGEKIVKEFVGYKDNVIESIMIDTADSTPQNPEYFIISICANDDRIIVRNSKSNKPYYFSTQGLKFNEPFTNYKLQLVKNQSNQYKLISFINSQSGISQLVIWELINNNILNSNI